MDDLNNDPHEGVEMTDKGADKRPEPMCLFDMCRLCIWFVGVAIVPVTMSMYTNSWEQSQRVENEAAQARQREASEAAQTRQLRAEYLRLAVSVVREPPDQDSSPALRDWAVKVLYEMSRDVVPLGDTARDELLSAPAFQDTYDLSRGGGDAGYRDDYGGYDYAFDYFSGGREGVGCCDSALTDQSEPLVIVPLREMARWLQERDRQAQEAEESDHVNE